MSELNIAPATATARPPSPAALLPVLPLALTLELREPLRLPPYAGSTFRGALGMALKRLACPLRDQACDTCLLRAHCVYLQLFDTPSSPGGDVPRPFVLEPPPSPRRGYLAGSKLRVGLTVVGRAIDHLPYFLAAIGQLGERWGLGRGRAHFQLIEAREATGSGNTPLFRDGRFLREPRPLPDPWEAPVPAIDEITLDLLTPLRLRVRGDLQTPDTPPDFALLMDRLAGRIRMLAASHGADPAAADSLRLPAGSATVEQAGDPLHWREWGRYSRRQERSMQFGGVWGRLTYRGDLATFVPWLQFGRWLHVGNGATFGLGRYRLIVTDRNTVCEDEPRGTGRESDRAKTMG